MPIGNFGNFGNFLVLFELFQNLYEKYHPEDTDFQWEKSFHEIGKFPLGNLHWEISYHEIRKIPLGISLSRQWEKSPISVMGNPGGTRR